MERTAVMPPSVGDLGVMVTSFSRSLRAANKAPRTIQAYLEACDQLGAFLASRGMPADVASITGVVTLEARALIGSHQAVTGFTIDQIDRFLFPQARTPVSFHIRGTAHRS